MATLTVLGSGSGMPQAVRGCSGYLVEHQEILTLLDCGSGVARAIQANGFRLTELDRVIISHTHPDHVSDLPLLIQHCHLSKKSTPLEVFVPSEFVASLNQIIRAMYVIPERFKFEVRIQGYEARVLVEHPLQIEAIANNHFRSYAADIQRLGLPNKLQSHSLRVTIDNKSLFYSGDVENFEDIVSAIGDVDMAIIETSHVDLAKVDEFAIAHPSAKVILTHFTDGESVQLLSDLAKRNPNVILANDGMRVEVGPH